MTRLIEAENSRKPDLVTLFDEETFLIGQILTLHPSFEWNAPFGNDVLMKIVGGLHILGLSYDSGAHPFGSFGRPRKFVDLDQSAIHDAMVPEWRDFATQCDPQPHHFLDAFHKILYSCAMKEEIDMTVLLSVMKLV